VLEFAGWQREFGPKYGDVNDTVGATPGDVPRYRAEAAAFAAAMAATADA